MMETASTSETSVNFYQSTGRYNPEDSHLHIRSRENLKSYPYYYTLNAIRCFVFFFRSITSTCSLPSIGSRQPPRKKLEEVSGFVVVTKQNYYKTIRKKQQTQKEQREQHSPGKETYYVQNLQHVDRYDLRDTEDQKEDEGTEVKQGGAETARTRNGSTAKCFGTGNDSRSDLGLECDEKENELVPVDNSNAERRHAESVRPKVTLNMSRVTQRARRRNSTEDIKNDGNIMIPEGCVEGQCTARAAGNTRQQQVCTSAATADLKTLDKIEAIEGWIKIYESEFFTERNKEKGDKIATAPEIELIQKNIQELGTSAAVPGSKSINSQPSRGYVHKYVQATGSLTQNECTSIPECSGPHPRTETTHKSASVKRSQQDLDSLKYISAESLKETQFNEKNCGSENKETSLPKTFIKSHQINDLTVNHERSQDYFGNAITNLGAESVILENVSLSSANDSQQVKCARQRNDTDEGQISVEPICKAVRVVQQQQEQSSSLQFTARSEVNKHSTKARNNATLEEIEAMIEPKLKEPSAKKHTYKERRTRPNTEAKTEQSRTSVQSLIPDIVQVKLGIENQFKILDKLDLMMKSGEIVERGTYNIDDTHAVLVPCSKNLVTEHKTSDGTGNTEVASCGQFNFSSVPFHSKPAAGSESSEISATNEVHGECTAWGEVPFRRQQVSPQCPGPQNFTAIAHGTSQGHPAGEYRPCNWPVSIPRNTFCRAIEQVLCL
jgi:hypothetical protein